MPSADGAETAPPQTLETGTPTTNKPVFGGYRMELLWSPVVATDRNLWQIGVSEKGLDQQKLLPLMVTNAMKKGLLAGDTLR